MHEKALSKEVADFLPRFAKFPGFYLVGGTALALQIGHRASVDFDFFSYDELPSNILQKTKRIFHDVPVTLTYRSPDQLNILIGNIKTTFLHFPYPTVLPVIQYRDISLASVSEIAAMKAFAMGKRLSYKDYIDWYFLLKENHIRIDDILLLCKKKFGNDFNDRLFLGQLVSLDEVPTQKIDFLRDSVEREHMEKFFQQLVQTVGL
ncbi:MAG: nucleotidyl transferase AbiEii/AbiGii toxin family protein [Candidatus Wildermuthbacteria bacterium]|nr:nucleotidyl transferase AbiEii/AbiGii toxin family protein [Candidatus Wildermuthbacteria bacterium]